MDYKDKEICNRIIEVMRERGLSQKELCVLTGIAQPSVSAILKMKRSPMPLVTKIAEHFNISQTWLLTGNGSKYIAAGVEASDIPMDEELSTTQKVELLRELNRLYSRHQEIIAEEQEIMKKITEMNKRLILGNKLIVQ